MAKVTGRARQFQDPDEKRPKDYDPEGDRSDASSGSEDSEDEKAGTEHYEKVGKSKLRQKEALALGAKYSGSRVSRKALEDDDDEGEEDSDEGDYDDPETADLSADAAEANDSEIDSDDALADSDAERLSKFTFRGSSKPVNGTRKAKRATAADFMSDDDEGMNGEIGDESDGGVGSSEDDDMDDGLDDLVNGLGSDDEDDDSGADEDMDDGLDDLVKDLESGDEDDEEDEDEQEDESEDVSESESEDEAPKSKGKSAAPNLGVLSNNADVEKGTAIQKQRKIYDGLLNLRIRLQKALVAANTFPTIHEESSTETEPYEAAEEAAIKLLDTISTMKSNFAPLAKTGEKRKRSITTSTSTQEIWDQIQADDERATKFREDRLEKWSRKVQAVNNTSANGLGSRSKSLISALQDQLSNPENRLVKRTRVPRSCAPAQAAQKIAEDEAIYDDADFYQALLKELVDQRTVDSASASGALPSVMLSAAREAKTRKDVDRKASKGRKMRFTVHEKLQNMMPTEDRGGWEEAAVGRFFGGLFGLRMEVEDESDSDDDVLRAEEEGLKLFRS